MSGGTLFELLFMNHVIPATLIVENPKSPVSVNGQVFLKFVPRQGDYISHEPEPDTTHLYRVRAVVFPTNPDSDEHTFDVHVVDEGLLNFALEKVLSQNSATFTKAERLILRNQHELLSHLDKPRKAWHETAMQTFERGYEYFYKDCLGDIEGAPADANVSEFVMQVLNMYTSLYDCLARDEARYLRSRSYASFPGFDGNDEAEYLDFAIFVLEKKQLFKVVAPNFRQKGVNSHHRTLSAYRRMLQVWSTAPNKYVLDVNTALAMLDAAEQYS